MTSEQIARLDMVKSWTPGQRCHRRMEPTHNSKKYPHKGTLSLQKTKMLDMALYSFASTANPVWSLEIRFARQKTFS